MGLASIGRPRATAIRMLPVRDPLDLWRDFAAAVGAERIAAAFRPTDGALYSGERRWVAVVDGARVGWSGLVRSPYGTSEEMRLGVFPTAPHRGLMPLLRDWLLREAFRAPAVEHVEAIIRATNPLARAVVADCAAGRGPWTYSGMLVEPPPIRHVFVVRREDWRE